MTTTILVVGATGKQGGKALSSLFESAQTSSLSLRFLTRNPASPAARKLVARGAEAVKGDLLDPSSLDAALQGVDRAFFMTDAAGGEVAEVKQGTNFVDAAKRAGIRHLVYTSSCAADTAPTVPHFVSKWDVEKHLQASGIPYTILRPVVFMDNFVVEPGFMRFMGIGAPYAFAKGRPLAMIACEDIGVFAAKALLSPTDPAFSNTTIDLSAGEYSLDQVRESIKRAQGGSPWLASFFPGFLRSVILPKGYAAMFKFFADTGYPAVDVAALRKVHPGLMSVEDYFRIRA